MLIRRKLPKVMEVAPLLSACPRDTDTRPVRLPMLSVPRWDDCHQKPTMATTRQHAQTLTIIIMIMNHGTSSSSTVTLYAARRRLSADVVPVVVSSAVVVYIQVVVTAHPVASEVAWKPVSQGAHRALPSTLAAVLLGQAAQRPSLLGRDTETVETVVVVSSLKATPAQLTPTQKLKIAALPLAMTEALH